MCPIKIDELNFDHLVIFEKDRTIFAAARENGNNHLRIFLIYADTGNTYSRNGRADSWEEVDGAQQEAIIAGLAEAYSRNIPTFKINGSHN